MKVSMMKEGSQLGLFGSQTWQIGIVGEVLDERGRAAVESVSARCSQVITMSYDPDAFTMSLDGTTVDADGLDQHLTSLVGSSVLIEASTMGFVEIFLCCRALVDLGFASVDLVYVEPDEYANSRRSDILKRRDFELSKDVPGYRAIPKATRLLSDREAQHVVFLLGYEERRLEIALEDYQTIGPDSFSVVFGVPAYKPGWEMNSFSNNLRAIKGRNLRGGIHFCGAENPAATIDVLKQINNSLVPNTQLFVAPIGTKPHGIGVALYAATNRECAILYDHPVRSSKRTSKVGNWHLFHAEF